MLKSYLTMALRTLSKSKAYSFINIAGLAIGLTCTTLILLWVQDELSYNRFHEKLPRLYRVMESQHYANGEIFTTSATPAPLLYHLKERFPEFEGISRMNFWNNILIEYGEKRMYENDGLGVDPDFLTMFSFPLIKGDPLTALNQPDAVVLSETLAKKYFGNEDPIGKTIKMGGRDLFKITAIAADPPLQSSIKFNLLWSLSYLKETQPDKSNWDNNWLRLFAVLQPNQKGTDVSEKIKNVIIDRNPNMAVRIELFLQPLSDMYLYSDFNKIPPRINYVYILSGIAFLILLIACINFTNLATARSIKRAKEVGLRKVVGADRFQLIRQFLIESVTITLVAMMLSLILIELLIPLFNDLSGKQLSLRWDDIQTFSLMCAMVLFTGLVSGLYPAMVLSRYQPALVLKGSFSKSIQGMRLRKILVSLQFTLSIALVICTIIAYQQLQYMTNKNLGYDKEHLVYIRLLDDTAKQYPVLKEKLQQKPGIVSVSAADQTMTGFGSNTWGLKWRGQQEGQRILTTFLRVDYDFFETHGIQVSEGRFFSKNFAADSGAFIVNEAAIRQMKLENPLQETITLWNTQGPIVGVVKDFHFQSVHQEITPLIFILKPERVNVMTVRIGPSETTKTLASIEETWQQVMPQYPFVYQFVDEELEKLYKAEQRLTGIYTSFTVLAIIISCLGLFGLASFTTEQRTKEIGIRKVLGASIPKIIIMLSTEFLKLVLLSNIIAWPVAYFLMSRWLQDFAFRVDIGIMTFILAGTTALCIALITVSYQAIKASSANPVDALKYE
ncbi:MAG TPA: ABC transporter permease [bacterium]|nr:ABC transporter permease [bacterium]HMW32174.1 ABC transporter permease [bacterium]HMW35086.1 ABC transporter permease [bacterium]HMY34509.1 ABC transporter permease [bacterium]HMZ04339.1 ABC transporter permease [bacterium]